MIMKISGKCFIVTVIASSFLSACIYYDFSGGSRGRGVALVEVKGIIIDSDDVVEQLERARKDDGVRAVVVRVDSPGGSVGASQEIFRVIKELDKIKPVVASMGDIAASGGYYVSAGARKIFANEGTVTGSIGVRMEHINASGLFDFIRLKPETLKSGEYKDIGTSLRALKPDERKFLEAFLAELHEQFKADVAEVRNLEKSYVDGIADGRIYTGAKARELGLVDEIGGFTEAVKSAAEFAGIKAEPEVVKMKRKGSWWLDFFTNRLEGAFTGAARKFKYFLYEWSP